MKLTIALGCYFKITGRVLAFKPLAILAPHGKICLSSFGTGEFRVQNNVSNLLGHLSDQYLFLRSWMKDISPDQ